MAYIGSIPAYQASGVRPRDEFTADGTQICFPLSQSVPGSFESGVTIVLDNVPQQPVEAFTVVDTRTLTLTSISGTFTVNETITGTTSAATGTVLKVNLNNIVIRGLTGTFSSSEGITGGTSAATATTTSVTINEGSGILFSEAPTAASIIYVVHEGNATYNLVPTAASVGPSQLADNLRNFTVDTFTGDGTTTTFTLSDTPSSANSLLVMVDGIVQTRTTNYTLSGAVVTFTDAPDSSAAITIIHLGFSTISRTGLVDGSVTTSKIADNAITSAKLGFDVIVAEDIAANAITVAEIASGAVTPAKLSTGGLYWDTSSNVGIGTTSPAVPLAVYKASDSAINIQNSTSGVTNVDGLQLLLSGANGYVWNYESGANIFGTANTERMRITSGGLVGIGTNAPSYSFEVVRNANDSLTRLNAQNPNAGSSAVTILGMGNDQTSTGAGLKLGSSTWSSGANTVEVFNNLNGSIFFSTQGTERIRIPSDAGGIKFPATQSASTDPNTLDDYEEGTWTPIIKGTSTNPSYTTTTASGSYVKIGKVVYTSFIIIVSGVSSQGSGNIYLDALPFSVNDQSYAPTLTVMYNDTWDVDFRAMYGSGISWTMRPIGVSQSNATYGNSNLTTGYFSGSGWYLTT